MTNVLSISRFYYGVIFESGIEIKNDEQRIKNRYVAHRGISRNFEEKQVTVTSTIGF